MRSEYGARAVVDLAQHYSQGPVQSADIAGRQGIPEAYLEQLMTTLRKSGLIRSTRGPHGGHELARAPDEIRCADIVLALEGPLWSEDAVDGGASDVGRCCGLREVWQEAVTSAQRILEGVTVRDLLERQRARENRPMYHI